MDRIELGRTGLRVSRLAMGTVELGMDYGIEVPGDFGKPSEDDSVKLLRDACDAGINFFDTAPAYGVGEALLAKALSRRPDALIATKIDIPRAGEQKDRIAAVMKSVDRSLTVLGRDRLDVVQAHNATAVELEAGWLLGALEAARSAGKVRFIGATVYGEDAALAAIRMKVDVIQIAINLLDQRMLDRVLPAAMSAGTGVVARSVYLRGVLTSKSEWLPPELQAVRDAADGARLALGAAWASMPELALRFCLSLPGIHSALVGLRTERELQGALDAATAGSLEPARLQAARVLGIRDEALLDPRGWNLP